MSNIKEFKVGDIYTTNDGNDCETEAAIERIANVWSGIPRDHDTHEEFLLCLATPGCDGDPDGELPWYNHSVKVSRSNLMNLKALLEGIDFDTDVPTYIDYHEEV